MNTADALDFMVTARHINFIGSKTAELGIEIILNEKIELCEIDLIIYRIVV